MKTAVTKQDILDLLDRQAKEFHERLLESERNLEKEQKIRNAEFDKKLGQIAGTWGKSVEEMVRPKIIELFNNKGVQIQTSVQNVSGFLGNERYYEIDLLLINTNIAVAVEIKSTLRVEDVDEHLERLQKIQKVQPRRINLNGVTLYGAVAGMVVENDADRYAYKKGLYVLRQNGQIVDIVNDAQFVPKGWPVAYSPL